MLQEQKIQSLIDEFNVRLDEKDEELLKIKEDMIKEKSNILALLDQIEDDVDKEFLQKKTNYLTKIRELKKVNMNLRGELGSYKMKTKLATEEVEDLSHLIDKYEEDLELLQISVNEKRNIKQDLTKQINSKDEVIQEKNNQLFDENLKLKEREKESTVMKENIKSLEETIEPLVLEMQAKKEAIEELEVILDDTNMIIERMELFYTEQQKIGKTMEGEVQKHEQIIRESNNIISRMTVEMHHVSQQLQNPIMLRDAVARLYHKYADETSFSGTKGEELDSRVEFSRQRQLLENNVVSLRSRMDVCSKKNESYYQMMEENMVLIEEVNKLRKDVKDYHVKYNNLESLLKIEDNKKLSPRQARMMLETVTTVDAFEKKYRDQIDDLRNKVSVLESELNRVSHIATK
ncbi:repetitive organellar protein-like isoform X2 [Adelges cooleyi]|nr:repetitive organellar protein-like isoform X2 [Adelges cooleyi]